MAFEVQFNSAVFEDSLAIQFDHSFNFTTVEATQFQARGRGEPGTQVLIPWINFSFPTRHFSFIKSFPLTIILVVSQPQLKMDTYWEKIVSRFWCSQCWRTFIWGVGDIWRLWLVQRCCVSVISWLHKSTQTCLNFILFPQCIKWGTWASLPAGAVLWFNWLHCLNLSLGMSCGFGCCFISGHLTLVCLFLSLLIFKSQQKWERKCGPEIVLGVKSTWLVLRALTETILKKSLSSGFWLLGFVSTTWFTLHAGTRTGGDFCSIPGRVYFGFVLRYFLPFFLIPHLCSLAVADWFCICVLLAKLVKRSQAWKCISIKTHTLQSYRHFNVFVCWIWPFSCETFQPPE